jgi:hypothetical protein
MTVLNTGASGSTGGGSNTAYRANSTLEFATVPGPGALAAVSLAAFLRRRRT